MEPEVRREIILDNYSNPFHKESKGEDFKTANANNSLNLMEISLKMLTLTEKPVLYQRPVHL